MNSASRSRGRDLRSSKTRTGFVSPILLATWKSDVFLTRGTGGRASPEWFPDVVSLSIPECKSLREPEDPENSFSPDCGSRKRREKANVETTQARMAAGNCPIPARELRLILLELLLCTIGSWLPGRHLAHNKEQNRCHLRAGQEWARDPFRIYFSRQLGHGFCASVRVRNFDSTGRVDLRSLAIPSHPQRCANPCLLVNRTAAG